MYSEATAGLFRANSEAASPNNLRLVDPVTPGTPAQDNLSGHDVGVSTAVTVSGIGYIGKAGGAAVVIPFFKTEYPTGAMIPTPLITNNNPTALKDALRAVLEMHEVDPVVTVSWNGDVIDLRHVGSGTLDYIVIDGVNVNVTRTAL